MKHVIKMTKHEALTGFAKNKHSQAVSATLDFGRGVLSVWLDNIHAVDYKIDEILRLVQENGRRQGVSIEYTSFFKKD